MLERREQFISEEVNVTRSAEKGHPISFRWKQKEYSITEIIAAWPDWGFGGGAPKRKGWRMRRHRNYYRVATADGYTFDLYHDRGLKLTGGKWILQSRIQ